MDLQIAQLFQSLDFRNSGRLSAKQVKGILATNNKCSHMPGFPSQTYVPETHVQAIVRRMDADGDESLSFSDFFSTLLPYFIYGDLRIEPTANQLAEKEAKSRARSQETTRRNLNRNRSKNSQRKGPLNGPRFASRNRELLLDKEDLNEENYFGLRGSTTQKNT